MREILFRAKAINWDECRQIALYDDELKGPCVVWVRNGDAEEEKER